MKTPMILWATDIGKEEDDCACEQMPKIALGTSNRVAGNFYQAFPWYEIALSENYTIAYSSTSYLSPLVLDLPAREILAAFKEPASTQTVIQHVPHVDTNAVLRTIHRLATLGFLVPIQTDCACDPNEGDTYTTAISSQLASWLHLTDRCNLRCSYCYLPHVREDMSSETGYAAVDATFRSAIANHFKQVKFKYAGGEPLLQFSLIVELHNYARSLAEKHGLGLEGVVLSNGTLLTCKMIGKLKLLGLRLMISLDGLGQDHDAHRPYAGGRGSFKDVAEAVDLALAHELVPNISVTVSSRTADGLADVMAWILERDLPFSLNFYRENELSASHDDMQLDEQKIIDGMLAAFKVVENNLPRRPFLGGIIDRANLSVSHTHTCGVGQNYLVFDQNGQVAKCQMHILKPITDIHAADPLAIIRADQISIQNFSVEEKERCKTCEWKYWCAGGCPLATYRATGRYDVKSPNCNIYKALFPEALRLEGLRLLKYRDDPEVVISF